MGDSRKTAPARDQLASFHRRGRVLNFGCGAVLGFAMGLLSALSSAEGSIGMAVSAGLVLAALLGSLCAVLGESLLERVFRWLSWWI